MVSKGTRSMGWLFNGLRVYSGLGFGVDGFGHEGPGVGIEGLGDSGSESRRRDSASGATRALLKPRPPNTNTDIAFKSIC